MVLDSDRLIAFIAGVALLAVFFFSSNGLKSNTNSTFELSQLASKSNALFGIPNSEAYQFFGSIGPYTNRSQNISYYFANGYGLNFTAPIMGGNNEASLSYNLSIPRWARNYSAPATVLVSIFKYSNAADLRFPKSKNGIFYFNNSNYYVSNAIGAVEANMSTQWMNISGGTGSLITMKPAYGSLELSQFNIAYKNYLVIVAVYGINNEYDKNYTIELGQHMYDEMCTVLTNC